MGKKADGVCSRENGLRVTGDKEHVKLLVMFCCEAVQRAAMVMARAVRYRGNTVCFVGFFMRREIPANVWVLMGMISRKHILTMQMRGSAHRHEVLEEAGRRVGIQGARSGVVSVTDNV